MKAKKKIDIDTLLKGKQHKDKRPINELEHKFWYEEEDHIIIIIIIKI